MDGIPHPLLPDTLNQTLQMILNLVACSGFWMGSHSFVMIVPIAIWHCQKGKRKTLVIETCHLRRPLCPATDYVQWPPGQTALLKKKFALWIAYCFTSGWSVRTFSRTAGWTAHLGSCKARGRYWLGKGPPGPFWPINRHNMAFALCFNERGALLSFTGSLCRHFFFDVKNRALFWHPCQQQ